MVDILPVPHEQRVTGQIYDFYTGRAAKQIALYASYHMPEQAMGGLILKLYAYEPLYYLTDLLRIAYLIDSHRMPKLTQFASAVGVALFRHDNVGGYLMFEKGEGYIWTRNL